MKSQLPQANIPEEIKLQYQQAMQRYKNKLIELRMSKSTCDIYYSMFRSFLKSQYPLPMHLITIEEIEAYHLVLITQKKLSASSQNQSINAIKFYMEKVLGLPKAQFELSRPKKAKRLPTVLSQEEVSRILLSPKNLKHRLILQLIYSSGLRISELINLKIADIDSDNMRIWIRCAKGQKGQNKYVVAIGFGFNATIL